ncbi:PREDICTED: CASP-like protein POPTRDRAFT_578614-like [Fragaria vesca subsp. vesca]
MAEFWASTGGGDMAGNPNLEWIESGSSLGLAGLLAWLFVVGGLEPTLWVSGLLVLVYVDAVVAGYNLLRLIAKFPMSAGLVKENPKGSNVYVAWLSLLLDQIAVYVAFGANSAAFQAALVALKGIPEFQWMKLCNKYSRFCFQIGGALSCGYLACLLMILISFITAFKLFRLYSPKKLFVLKSISG